MKVKSAKKYAKSFLAAIGTCVILSGCGKNDEEVKEPVVVVEKESENTAITPVVSDIPNIGLYDGNSIVEALNSINYDSSLESRKLLAERLAISNYTGTAEQNSQMLAILKYYAAEYRTYIEENTASSDWIYFDDDFEIRRNEEGKIEYRNHNYTNYITVLGTDTEKRSCRGCGHEQYRNNVVTENKEWTAIDDVYETDGSERREHTYSNWISVLGTEDQVKRTCSTCGHQEYRTVGISQKQ